MQTFTVELEERVYDALLRTAGQLGKTPEEMTAQWIAATVEQLERQQTNLSTESALDELPETR